MLSIEQALEILNLIDDTPDMTESDHEAILMAQDALFYSRKRKKAHYVKGENGEWYCSSCKRIDDKHSIARFCWWCGADMCDENELNQSNKEPNSKEAE